jgi:P-type E1-E2 ATPase
LFIENVTVVAIAIDAELVGWLIALFDQLRLETPRALRMLRKAGGARIVMLTGDRQKWRQYCVQAWRRRVLAELTPEMKLAHILDASDSFNDDGCDGVNDAPATCSSWGRSRNKEGEPLRQQKVLISYC